jgi:hypothetical protein
MFVQKLTVFLLKAPGAMVFLLAQIRWTITLLSDCGILGLFMRNSGTEMNRAFSAEAAEWGIPGALPQANMIERLWR